MAIQIGDKIPEILGPDQDGKLVRSSDYDGKKIVLYFCPKDSTPGCTEEACSFRDNYHTMLQKGYVVFGVSVDSAKSHKRFIEKNALPFHLISDEQRELVQLFGVWGEKTMAGRKYMGIFRTTFLFNEQGILEQIILPKSIKTKEHATQILEIKQ